MRILTQNIKQGSIKVASEYIAKSDYGLAVFVGFTQGDNYELIDRMIDKLLGLRVFPDENGKTNHSIDAVNGSLLLIPNFTLYASVVEGRRPSFSDALAPLLANQMFDYFVGRIKEKYGRCSHGIFGADMEISLVNDGPFSLFIDSDQLFGVNL